MSDYTILFVDDEPNVLRAIERMFRRSSYRVLFAESGEKALEAMERENVNVLITDQRMPLMTGIELCRQVAQLHPLTIRFILSGYADMGELLASIEQGEVQRFLSKPIDMYRLLDIVDRAVEQIQVIQSVKQIVDELNRQGTGGYRYHVDFTSGNIEVGIRGGDSCVKTQMISSLLRCLFELPDDERHHRLIGSVMARQNGSMKINVEFGVGVSLAVDLPIEEEKSSHEQ